MGIKITVQAAGGNPRTLESAATVGDAKRAVGLPNHTALVNGNPAADSASLPDYAFITLSENVKGGC